MTAEIIDGKAIAARVRGEVAAEVAEWVQAGHPPPGLATVLVGEDPASAVYVGGKQRACSEVGIRGFDHRLDRDTPQGEIQALLERLNADPEISGILLQLPTPPQIDGSAMSGLIAAFKDVDGLTAQSAGLLQKNAPGLRPCTPLGVMEPATSRTPSYSTSPTRPSSVRFIPTSMTVAPGLTQSGRTISGRPTAATSTSARRQTAGRSRVRE